MIPLVGVLILLATWIVICVVSHGYANTIDSVAYWLHRHARGVREMHARRAGQIQTKWVRELEVSE